jgi:hypothetical protein
MSIFQYLARCGVSALLLLLPLGAVAEPPSERATITLEVTDRAALALALAELEAKGVVRESKVNYKAPERVATDRVTTESIVAERVLKKSDAVRLDVELISIRYDQEGKGVFTTATGTVWRETVASPARSRLDPRKTYKGIITTGMIGGFRLNLEGVVRELKVEPIRTP